MVTASLLVSGCGSSSPEDSSADNPLLYENLTFTSRLLIDGYAANGTIIRNCTFIDIADDAILLRDVNEVTIENCTFTNCGGHAAIRLSSYGSTDQVIITGNTIIDSPGNGIVAGNYESDGHQHTNVTISNNTIHNSGLGSPYSGLTHHIYVQAPDALIEGNVLSGTRDGNGISIRSSGIVRNNRISGHSLGGGKSAIRYYSDHRRGPLNRLLIENNMVDNRDGPSELITIFEPAGHYDGESDHVVEHIIIRFNTSISTHSAKPSVRIDGGYAADPYVIEIYGNLLVNTVDNLFIYSNGPLVPQTEIDNLTMTDLTGFAGADDFHLLDGHPAIGHVDEVSEFPADDIDGDQRLGPILDAGADQTVASVLLNANS